MRVKEFFAFLCAFLLLFINCSKDNDGSEVEQKKHCGDGSGYEIEFCGQIGYYEAGYGVPGLDEINVTCIVGPREATVSNQTNGTYYCSGQYKLTSFDEGEISICWGGTTYYDNLPEDYQITRGEGTFSLEVTKKSGGTGNIFLAMSSGSMWMFDVVLINICDSLKSNTIKNYKLEPCIGPNENDNMKHILHEYR